MSLKGGFLTAGLGVTSRATGQVSALVVVLVATRFLSPADFGVFSLAAAGITLIRTMLYSGSFEYLMKSVDPERINNACLQVNLIISIGLTICLVALAALTAPLFKSPGLLMLLIYLAPSNVISAFSAWQESHFLRGRGVKPYYVATAVGEILAGAVGIALLFAGWGVMSLVMQIYARAAILLLAYVVLQRPTFSGPTNLATIREILSWSWPRYGGVVIGFASGYGGDFVLGAMLSPTATGLYRAGNRITSAVADLFAQPASLIGSTVYSRRAANALGAADILPRFLLAVHFVGWPALAGLALVAGDLTPILLGPAWAGTGAIIAVICISRAVSLIGASVSPYLVAYNRQRLLLIVQSVSAVLTIGVLVATAHHGLVQAAAAMAVVAVAVNFALLWFALKVEPVARQSLIVNGATVVAAVVATVVPALAVLTFVPVQEVWRLPVAIAAGIAGWGVVLVLARARLVDALHALEPDRR